MPGPPPKPPALRRRDGNPSTRPIVDEPRVGSAVDAPHAFAAPECLRPAAVGVWNEIVPELVEIGLVPSVDTTAVEAMCDAVATAREAREIPRRRRLRDLRRPCFISGRSPTSFARYSTVRTGTSPDVVEGEATEATGVEALVAEIEADVATPKPKRKPRAKPAPSDGRKGKQRFQPARVVEVERVDAADPPLGRVLVHDGVRPRRGDDVGMALAVVRAVAR